MNYNKIRCIKTPNAVITQKEEHHIITLVEFLLETPYGDYEETLSIESLTITDDKIKFGNILVDLTGNTEIILKEEYSTMEYMFTQYLIVIMIHCRYNIALIPAYIFSHIIVSLQLFRLFQETYATTCVEIGVHLAEHAASYELQTDESVIIH